MRSRSNSVEDGASCSLLEALSYACKATSNECNDFTKMHMSYALKGLDKLGSSVPEFSSCPYANATSLRTPSLE